MSLKKKVKRNLGKLRTARDNQVDNFNEEAIANGLANNLKSVKILHPTKGFRNFSLSRFKNNHVEETVNAEPEALKIEVQDSTGESL